MRRRLLLVAAVAALLASCGGGGDGDDRPDRTIAFLRAVPNDEEPRAAFLEPLADAGWVEGENLTVLGADPTEVHTDDAAEAVAGWVEEGADLVVALSSSGARIADQAASDVPVLFLSTDPVATGLVADERTPEGHLTGGTFQVPADRTLDIALRALGGGPVRFGLLWPEGDPAAEPVLEEFRRAAGTLDVDVVDQSFSHPAEVASAVLELVGRGAEALVLANAPTLVAAFDDIEAAAAEHRLPVFANTTNDFSLVTLQPDTEELYRQLGRQAARLLGGTPVAEVPVEDPAGYVVVVDRRSAGRLGITLPEDLLALADEVVR